MLRIRFHGRGGHGVKTASRLLGAAGFRAGMQCQDSPIYGAERRGAAVTAFTRLDSQPIRERGPIARPDLIVVADETLLADPAAGVRAGAESAAGIFVNRPPAAADLGDLFPPLIAFDLTASARTHLGRGSALSAGLGAAAARLVGGIPWPAFEEALAEELGALRLDPAAIDANRRLSRAVWEALAPLDFSAPRGTTPPASGPTPSVSPTPERVVEIGYDGPNRGAPSVFAVGNAALRNTGAWRLERPVIDRAACTRCGLCFVQCPDGAIALDAEGYPVIDYDHCKGCLICRQVCPLEAIRLEPETRAW